MCTGTSGLPLGRDPEGAASVSKEEATVKEDVGYKRGCPKRNKVMAMGSGNQTAIKQR